MNCAPAKVDKTSMSRKLLSDWTSCPSSDPYAADAMTQGRTGRKVVKLVVVVVRVTVGEYDVVVVAEVDVAIAVLCVSVLEVNVTLGE